MAEDNEAEAYLKELESSSDPADIETAKRLREAQSTTVVGRPGESEITSPTGAVDKTGYMEKPQPKRVPY